MTWMRNHRRNRLGHESHRSERPVEAFLASHPGGLIESRLPGSASATARDVVAQHFAHSDHRPHGTVVLSGLEVNPSLAITRMQYSLT